MKQIDRLLRDIINLDPVEFMGLARVLKVKLMEPDYEKNEDGENTGKVTLKPRDFTDILSDVLAAFEASNRKRRREILQLIHEAATHKEVIPDAGNSKDP